MVVVVVVAGTISTLTLKKKTKFEVIKYCAGTNYYKIIEVPDDSCRRTELIFHERWLTLTNVERISEQDGTNTATRYAQGAHRLPAATVDYPR